MRTIAIALCDTDFSSTFTNLLETIQRVIEYNSKVSEDEIVSIIKSGISFHYLAFSNWAFMNSPLAFAKTIEYLTDGIEILFDEEAEDKILNTDHGGGSWYLSLQDGTIGRF